MDPAKFPPNPLVVELAHGLGSPSLQKKLKTAQAEAEKAADAADEAKKAAEAAARDALAVSTAAGAKRVDAAVAAKVEVDAPPALGLRASSAKRSSSASDTSTSEETDATGERFLVEDAATVAQDEANVAAQDAQDKQAQAEAAAEAAKEAEQTAPGVLGEFGIAVDSTEIKVLAGLLGGRWSYPPNAPDKDKWWRVLFLDVDLQQWILIQEREIKHCYRVEDHRIPGGSVDYIWLSVETPIAVGGPQTDPRNLFLTGAFTRAGDYQTSVRGDTYSPASGLLCDAVTPGGCGGNTPRGKGGG